MARGPLPAARVPLCHFCRSPHGRAGPCSLSPVDAAGAVAFDKYIKTQFPSKVNAAQYVVVVVVVARRARRPPSYPLLVHAVTRPHPVPRRLIMARAVGRNVLVTGGPAHPQMVRTRSLTTRANRPSALRREVLLPTSPTAGAPAADDDMKLDACVVEDPQSEELDKVSPASSATTTSTLASATALRETDDLYEELAQFGPPSLTDKHMMKIRSSRFERPTVLCGGTGGRKCEHISGSLSVSHACEHSSYTCTSTPMSLCSLGDRDSASIGTPPPVPTAGLLVVKPKPWGHLSHLLDHENAHSPSRSKSPLLPPGAVGRPLSPLVSTLAAAPPVRPSL